MLDFEDILFEDIRFNARASIGGKKKSSARVLRSRAATRAQARGRVSTPNMAAIKAKVRAMKASKVWPRSAPKPAPKAKPRAASRFTTPNLTVSSRLAAPSLTVSKPAISRQIAVSPKVVAAAMQATRARTKLATNITGKAISRLARKAPLLPVQSSRQIEKKALEAVGPIARACKCTPAPVIQNLNRQLTKKGYPAKTATSLLAGIHDMNESLEKAAVQRIATHEHKAINNEQAFRCKVLRKLTQLAKCLPECHPARTRAHLTILRKG